jgi:hypothetical protein
VSHEPLHALARARQAQLHRDAASRRTARPGQALSRLIRVLASRFSKPQDDRVIVVERVRHLAAIHLDEPHAEADLEALIRDVEAHLGGDEELRLRLTSVEPHLSR